jgi:cobalt-precorrin-5B (C1)-methyltransferase
MSEASQHSPLRRGWTTGACATAAARAAFEALTTGAAPPDPVEIVLPSGQRVAFALAQFERGSDFTRASVIKDAGDDPDVTHGAMICVTLRHGAKDSGVVFLAGRGVGTVTRPGLPLPPGEPAINPVPRAMIRQVIGDVAARLGVSQDVLVEISIPDGERLAQQTLNPRLGIVGGLSILGTTGIVIPFSCAAWIDSIHRSIDVARAVGCQHIAATTGVTSEKAAQSLYQLPDVALVEMGDFVGGFLKYLRAHPVPRVTIGGGFAKMVKLSQGRLDLHSGRSKLDLEALSDIACRSGADHRLAQSVRQSNTALEARQLAQQAGVDLAAPIAEAAWKTAAQTLDCDKIDLDIVVFDREGALLARTPTKRAVR